ncbi:MAG TPA: twin-arginine translocase TatA/TatE family subunit [Candidatus Nitrosotenuis sp.]|nr:twin-arginine translocase TatA/TatE family subunit [Candidatus Nitrosotenuis sp.]
MTLFYDAAERKIVGPLGVPELIFIFVLALLVFGPKKLPELGRTVGKALTEFRRASNELRSAVESEVRDLEREAQETGRQVREATSVTPLDSGESSMPTEPSAPAATSSEEAPADGDHKPA